MSEFEDLVALLAHWGVHGVTAITPTASELDRTLLVTAESGNVVLKISPAGSSAPRMQSELLQAVAVGAPALPVPRVLLDERTGAPVDAAGTTFVSTMLPGHPLEAVSLTERLIDQIAEAQATLLSALARVDAVRAAVPATNEWAIDAIERYEPLFAVHLDVAQRDTAGRVLEAYRLLKPALASLPVQVLHADFNLSNLFVTDGSLSGIIDFGDAIEAPRLFDIAVTVAYLSMHLGSTTHPLVDRYIGRIGPAIALDANESALLIPLALCRIVLVLVLGRESGRRRPDRASYQKRYDALATRILAAVDSAISPTAHSQGKNHQ
ncbi:phosphotransferase enzyme family protein [Microbacterium tumbae]